MSNVIAHIKYATKDILNRYNTLLAKCFNEDGSFNQKVYENESFNIQFMGLTNEIVALMIEAGNNAYAVSLVRGVMGHLQDSAAVVVDSQITLSSIQ